MRHALTTLLCLLCGGCCAKGCPTLGERFRLAYKRHELRMVLVDWGVKPHLLPLLFCLLLPSCAFYCDPDGTVFAMTGTNAQSVSAGGLRMEGVNQTDAINTIGRTVVTNSITQNGADVLKTGIDEGADLIQDAIE